MPIAKLITVRVAGRCRKIAQAPNATKNGAKFKNKVALATLVYRNDQCRQRRSSAKKPPAAMSHNSSDAPAREFGAAAEGFPSASKNGRNAGAAKATL
jgi:hypothetical protein